MAGIQFNTVWKNHPANEATPNINPCNKNGTPNHDNQCVIRLGLALVRSGVSLNSFNGAFCWSGHGRQHPLRVEEFKKWLNSSSATFVGSAVKYKKDARGNQKSSTDFAGKRGIVAFLDFWGANNTGDHIDLWNGTKVAHGSLDYFSRSRELWFWAMP
jgi:hypothetical protein